MGILAAGEVAIATTNPTLGDTIFVMAGHAENVTASEPRCTTPDDPGEEPT